MDKVRILFLFFFILFFPYYLMGLKRVQENKPVDEKGLLFQELRRADEDNPYRIVVQKDDGKEMPLQEGYTLEVFVSMELAALYDAGMEEENLKALAILLRTNLYQKYLQDKEKNMLSHVEKEIEKGGSLSENQLNDEKARVIYISPQDFPFLSEEAVQSRWQGDYEKVSGEILKAVLDTRGMVACYEKRPIIALYHLLSNGSTRDLAVANDKKRCPYLRSVTCADDLADGNFLQKKVIPVGLVGELTEAHYDAYGYLLSVKRDGKLIKGQQLSQELDLASSCVKWEKKGEGIEFQTKGIGHGYGYSISYANVLAGRGKNYQELLDYFFEDIKLERLE